MSRTKDFAPYAKRRFIWKRAIQQDPYISRGAKLLATCLCDTYVNKHTGECWPKNDTLAKRLQVSKRTVQRHYRDLETAGYLSRVRVGLTRRAHRISILGGWGDNEDDRMSPQRVTKLTSHGDTNVTPYKNQGKNKGNARTAIDLQYFTVGVTEQLILDGWGEWLVENTDHEIGKLFELLRKGAQVYLPARYPKADDARRYQDFFEMVIASNGKCFGA